MPTLPQGRLFVFSFSLILSCVAIGVSISLLFAPRPEYSDPPQYDSDTWEGRGPGDNMSLHTRDPYADYDGLGFRNVPILGLVASAFNFVIVAPFLIAPIMNPKSVISTVAIEAPCIYLVSFLWLATAAYAEHSIESGTNCFPPPSVGFYCSEHKVLEGISFVNWIQLMLYANTLMTVATICHVRKHRVWFRRVVELPTFSAPALTFGPRLDDGFDSPFIVKSNESTVPLLGDPMQPVDLRASHQFRSRIALPPHPSARPGIPSSASHSPLPSDSTTSLVPTVATEPDIVTPQNATSYPRPDMGHHPMGEPPTYSGPGSTYELITV